MRVIDADKLKQTIGSYNPIKYTYEYGDVITVADIDNAPTIEPVKRGKWFYDTIADEYLVYRCSACDIPSDLDTPYCPWCGARMSEGSEE